MTVASENAAPTRTGTGKTEITIGPENGRVVMGFPNPITWFAMDPLNAAQIGRELINAATKLGADVQIIIPKKQITETQRRVLITRVHLVMKNQLEKHIRPERVAQQLVDIVLAEMP